MFATIYLPDFYLQAALRHQPDLTGKPVALIDDQEKKAVIIPHTRFFRRGVELNNDRLFFLVVDQGDRFAR